MIRETNKRAPKGQVAIDIGSTVVKIARLGPEGRIAGQEFYPRDFHAGIARQVEDLLAERGIPADSPDILVCSSANGGLRVGIVCLTRHFSGAALRDQVLLAGANPVFTRDLDQDDGEAGQVDILLVGGGIDCADAAPLEQRLKCLSLEKYRYGSLLYAGNSYLAKLFRERFPQAIVVANPIAEQLVSKSAAVYEVVRRAYLDDLVYKEGVSELKSNLSRGIRPTPEIVNLGLQRSIESRSNFAVIAPCVLLDIGGATTDLHYSVEAVREDSAVRPAAGFSTARYVFTDLGIVASRETLLLQLRRHPRLHEFLSTVLGGDVTEPYRLLREGEYQPNAQVLSYACLFLALDRFAQGREPELPAGDLSKVVEVVLTGGAAQGLSPDIITRLLDLLLPAECRKPAIIIDRAYQIWVEGIAWSEHMPAPTPQLAVSSEG